MFSSLFITFVFQGKLSEAVRDRQTDRQTDEDRDRDTERD